MSSKIWKHHIDYSLINCTPQLFILKEIQSQKWMRSHNLYTGPPHQSINSHFHITSKSLARTQAYSTVLNGKITQNQHAEYIAVMYTSGFSEVIHYVQLKARDPTRTKVLSYCKPTYFWLWFKQCVNKWPSTDKCAHIHNHTHYPLSVILTGNPSLNIHEEPPTHV